MSATRDGGARVVALNAAQGMALGLGLAAAEAAGEAARLGGYRATADEWRVVTNAITGATLAMVALVEDWSALTDEQLEDAAADLGVRVLRELLGPPPMAH
jgi:hypothetical protein